MKFQEYLEDVLDLQAELMSDEELAAARISFESFVAAVSAKKEAAHPDMKMKLAELRERCERIVKGQKWSLEKQGNKSEGGKLAEASIEYGEALLNKKAKKTEFIAHAEMNSDASRALNAELVAAKAAKAAEKIAGDAAVAARSSKDRACNLGRFNTNAEDIALVSASKPKHSFRKHILLLSDDLAKEAATQMFGSMDLATAKMDLDDYKSGFNTVLEFERSEETGYFNVQAGSEMYTLSKGQYLSAMSAVILDLSDYEDAQCSWIASEMATTADDSDPCIEIHFAVSEAKTAMQVPGVVEMFELDQLDEVARWMYKNNMSAECAAIHFKNVVK